MNTKVAVQREPRIDETSEWIEAFDQVLAAEGREGAAKLVAAVSQRAQRLPSIRTVLGNSPKRFYPALGLRDSLFTERVNLCAAKPVS